MLIFEREDLKVQSIWYLFNFVVVLLFIVTLSSILYNVLNSTKAFIFRIVLLSFILHTFELHIFFIPSFSSSSFQWYVEFIPHMLLGFSSLHFLSLSLICYFSFLVFIQHHVTHQFIYDNVLSNFNFLPIAFNCLIRVNWLHEGYG